MTEPDLVKACTQGDAQAQRELYEQLSGRIFATILRYVPQYDDACDLLQETFIKVFAQIHTFTYRGEGSLLAWVHRIAVNAALNSIRQNKKLIDLEGHEPVEAADNVAEEPDAEGIMGIDTATIMQFVSELPDGYRTVFNMFCIDGYSHKQIAEHLGINEKSSSSQLTRAKSLLAKRIKEYLAKDQ